MLTPARLWVTAMRFEPMTWWFKSRPTYCALMTMRERFCPVSRSCHSDEHNEPTTTTGMPFSSDARMLMANWPQASTPINSGSKSFHPWSVFRRFDEATRKVTLYISVLILLSVGVSVSRPVRVIGCCDITSPQSCSV